MKSYTKPLTRFGIKNYIPLITYSKSKNLRNMKYKFIEAFLLSGLLCLAVACSPKKDEAAATPVDKEKIKQEIQTKENEFAEVYNSGELKNIGYYAEDAISYSQNRQPLVGRQAIIDYYKAGLDSSSKGVKISFTTNDVFVGNDANQVLEVGYYKLVDSTGIPINTGNYMVLFEKRNGQYVSVREMSTSDMAE
jgi:ketosteroid isomerase-like protein